MKRRPVPCRFAGAAVDDEVLRPLGNLGVEVVAEHPQRRLLLPAAGAELGAACGANRRRDGRGTSQTLGWHYSAPRVGPCPGAAAAPIFASRPLRTRAMAVRI